MSSRSGSGSSSYDNERRVSVKEEESDDIGYSYNTIWRRGEDKAECLLYDWTIVVTSSEDKKRVETFHVHRCHIISSDYFKELITMPENVKEHEDATIQISFCDSLMDVFPLILDYLYGVYNHKLYSRQEISERLGTAEKYAIAILSLARYFAMKKLIKATETIIIDIACDVENRNVVGSVSKGESISFMLSQAMIYSEDKMADVLIDACAREHAAANSHMQKVIMEGIPPDLKTKVLELSHNYTQEKVDMLVAIAKGEKNNSNNEFVDQYTASRRRCSVGIESVNGSNRYIGNFANNSMYSMSGTLDSHNQAFSLNADPKDKYPEISAVVDE